MTAPSIKEALKPCPFCNGEAWLLHGGPGNWFVQCTKCKCTTNDVQRDRAVELWNARATLQPDGERRDAIARALAEKWPGDYMQGDDECEREPNALAYETADLILASGLVQNEAGWQCAARKQSLPEPADCNWPMCGCDPYADKVIAALQESEPVSRIEELEAENTKLRRFLKCSRDEGTEALDRADKAEKALEAAIRSARDGGG